MRPRSTHPASADDIARLRERVIRKVEESPEKAAIILTGWTHEKPTRKKSTPSQKTTYKKVA